MLTIKKELDNQPTEEIVDVFILDDEKAEEEPLEKINEDANVQDNYNTGFSPGRSIAIQTDFLTILGKEQLLYHCPHCPAMFAALTDLNDHMAFKGASWLMENHIRNPDAPRPQLPPNVLVTHTGRKRPPPDEPEEPEPEPDTPIEDNEPKEMENQGDYEDAENSSTQDAEEDVHRSSTPVRKRRRRTGKAGDPSYEPTPMEKRTLSVPVVERTLRQRPATRKPLADKHSSSEESESEKEVENDDDDDYVEEEDDADESAEEQDDKTDENLPASTTTTTTTTADVTNTTVVTNNTSPAVATVTEVPKPHAGTSSPAETSRQILILKPIPKETPKITVKNVPTLNNEVLKVKIEPKTADAGKAEGEASVKKMTSEKRIMESLQKNHLLRLGLAVESRAPNVRFPDKVHPAISRLRQRVLPKEWRQNLKAIEIVQKLIHKVQAMKDKEATTSRLPAKATVQTQKKVLAPKKPTKVYIRAEVNKPQVKEAANASNQILVRMPTTSINDWMPKIVSSTTDTQPNLLFRTIPQGTLNLPQMTATATPNGPIILRPISAAGPGKWVPQLVTNQGTGQIVYRAIQQAPTAGNNAQGGPFILTPVAPSNMEGWMPKILETTTASVVVTNRTQSKPVQSGNKNQKQPNKAIPLSGKVVVNSRTQPSKNAVAIANEWSPQVSEARSLEPAPSNSFSTEESSIIPTLNIDLSILSNYE